MSREARRQTGGPKWADRASPAAPAPQPPGGPHTVAVLPPHSTWQRGSEASRLLRQVWWYLLTGNFLSTEGKAGLCSLPRGY